MFYPQANYQDKIRLYSVFGGTPFYLSQIDDSKSIKENIINLSLPDIDYTETEIYNNLIQEIRLPSSYLEILDVMAEKKKLNCQLLVKKLKKNPVLLLIF